jgi:tetratricopeptide (TPR) repeat protein
MKGLLDQALADCNRAIQLSPKFAEAYNNRALIFKKKGYLDQALSDFNKAIELKPNFAIAYYNRANLYFLKKEYDKSRQDVTKAESLGFVVDPQFIEKLKKASGRNE